MGRTGADPSERHSEKELETERWLGKGEGAVLLLEREKDKEEERGYTDTLRFMALTSVSFSTRCSQPICHAPPPPSSLALPMPPIGWL